MLPYPTKRRTTTNLKTKKNHNCPKIKLYGSRTTEDLEKKYSSRPVGWMHPEQRGHATDWAGEVVAGRPGGPTSVCG